MKDSQLLKKFRMVSVDRPGFGYSDFGDAQHLDIQSLRISPLFTQLANHKPMFLAGHSLGGPLVIKLGADNPGIFSGLVIISGSIDPKEENPEKWRPWLFNTSLNYLVPGALRPANEELWYLKKDLRFAGKRFFKNILPGIFYSWCKRYLGSTSQCDIWKNPAGACTCCGSNYDSGCQSFHSLDKVQRNPFGIVKIILSTRGPLQYIFFLVNCKS